MTDVDRVAAALHEARFLDEGPDAQDAVDIIAALAASGLTITEAPDAEGAGLRAIEEGLARHRADPMTASLYIAGWEDAIRALGRAAPPSSVDGERLRAALERIAAVYHFDGSHNAGGGPPTFRDCADDNCRVATKALAASGSAPSAAKEGPE